MPWLRTITTLDTRALLLFRIALGLVLLLDLAIRATSLSLHYGPDGLLPPDLREPGTGAWSLFLWFPSLEAVTAGFIVAALAAIALIVGWRTRLATLTLWVIVGSLQTRNDLVVNGGDALLRLLLFWSLFLPLDALGAVDRRDDAPATVCSPASAALLVQVCLVYVVTMVLKTGPSWWDGTALDWIFGDTSIATSVGQSFGALPGVPYLLTWVTVIWEILGVILVLSPWRTTTTRVIAIAGFLALHAGMGLTLRIGLFPLASMLSWLPFIPGPVFDRLGWVAGHSEAPRLGRAPTAMVLAALALTLGWNARSLGMQWPNALTPVVLATRLHQHWNMFAPEPGHHDYWYVFEGTTEDGRRVDLLNDPPLPDRRRPAYPNVPDRRWGKYLKRIRYRADARLQHRFANWLADRHEERSGERLAHVKLMYIKQHQKTDALETRVFWDADTEAEAPPKPSNNPVQRAIDEAKAAATR